MGSVIVPTLLLILTVLALFHTYQNLRWSATGIREKGSTLRSSTVAPAIQIFTVIDHSRGLSWERFFQNHVGWHKEFRNVLAYSFERAHGPLADIVTTVEKFSPEETSGSSNNLQVFGFYLAWKNNPRADWYLCVDDDTLIVVDNLRLMVSELDPNVPRIIGKPALANDQKLGTIAFVVGGAGILLSRRMVELMVPHIPLCRRKYNTVWHSDSRVGACIQFELNESITQLNKGWKHQRYPPAGFRFSNAVLKEAATRYKKTERPISIHEKDPKQLEKLHAVINQLRSQKVSLTFENLNKHAQNYNPRVVYSQHTHCSRNVPEMQYYRKCAQARGCKLVDLPCSVHSVDKKRLPYRVHNFNGKNNDLCGTEFQLGPRCLRHCCQFQYDHCIKREKAHIFDCMTKRGCNGNFNETVSFYFS